MYASVQNGRFIIENESHEAVVNLDCNDPCFQQELTDALVEHDIREVMCSSTCDSPEEYGAPVETSELIEAAFEDAAERRKGAPDREQRMRNALLVIIRTPEIRRWLTANDPKALAQAVEAVELDSDDADACPLCDVLLCVAPGIGPGAERSPDNDRLCEDCGKQQEEDEEDASAVRV